MTVARIAEETTTESTETPVVDGLLLRSLRHEAEELAQVPEVVVHNRSDTVSGTPIFVGTRVPVDNLFDYLEAGHSLDDFPSVSPVQAVAALKIARETLKRMARAGAA